MKRKTILNIAILICGVSLVLLQIFVSISFSDFLGTDDKSVEIIQEIAPDYQPWAKNIWVPQNDYSEILLFAFQAVLGLSIIIIYVMKQRNKIQA